MLPDVSAQQWKLAPHPPQNSLMLLLFFLSSSSAPSCISPSHQPGGGSHRENHCIMATHWWRTIFISITKIYTITHFFVLYFPGFCSAVNTHFFCLHHARRKKRSICYPWITWRSETWRKALCPQSISSQSSTPNRGQIYLVKWICVNAHVPYQFGVHTCPLANPTHSLFVFGLSVQERLQGSSPSRTDLWFSRGCGQLESILPQGRSLSREGPGMWVVGWGFLFLEIH